MWAHHLSVLSWHQEHEAAGHIMSICRQQRDTSVPGSILPPVQFRTSATLRVGLPTQLMQSGDPLSDTPNACFHGDSKSSQLTVRLTGTDTDEHILLRNGSLCRNFTLLTLIHFSISLFQKRKAALDEVSQVNFTSFQTRISTVGDRT